MSSFFRVRISFVSNVIRLFHNRELFPKSDQIFAASADFDRDLTKWRMTSLTEHAEIICHNSTIGGMPTVVYVDVLLFINTILTYAVLVTVEKLFKRSTRLWRLITSAFVGSLFSLLIFSGINSFLFSMAIKVISSLLITVIAFPFVGRREFFKTTLATVGVSVVYSGMFILFYQLVKPPNMLIMNDIVYFEFNPLVMIGFTAVIYLLITLFHKLFHERIKNTVVDLNIAVNNQEISCIGKVDTGCNLTEPFSGSPVIIVDESLFRLDDTMPRRVIPYTSVGGSSILYAVKAEKVIIDHKPIDKAVYIAVHRLNDQNIQAIINSEIIKVM